MGHDGRTNSFHVNVCDDIALTYNDISVLENMHISKTFKLMHSDLSTNILEGFKIEHRNRLRKEMVEVVLGTDMSSHFGNVADFKTLVEKLGSDPTEWHHEPKAMSALRVMALHAMDISNPAKVFFQEKHLGLPISPLCDRETVRFASSQVGFFTIIVQPTFTLMAELQHRVKDVLLTHLQTNTEAWEARKKKESGDVMAETVTKVGFTITGEGQGCSAAARGPKHFLLDLDEKKCVRIGRAPGNDIQVELRGCSQFHAEIRLLPSEEEGLPPRLVVWSLVSLAPIARFPFQHG
eukprot:g12771.t1